MQNQSVIKERVATWSELEAGKPAYAIVGNVDLVVVRWEDEDQVSVLFGRCQHRGAPVPQRLEESPIA